MEWRRWGTLLPIFLTNVKPPGKPGGFVAVSLNMKKVSIKKLDAAKEQLETAIHLFFTKEEKVVSIHTLASAALKVLMNLCDVKGRESFLAQWVQDSIKPEYANVFWKKFHASANFFKHAEKDADDILEFNPKLTEFVVMYAVKYYKAINGSLSEEMTGFVLWFTLKHPEFLISDKHREIAELGPRNITRKDFLLSMQLYKERQRARKGQFLNLDV